MLVLPSLAGRRGLIAFAHAYRQPEHGDSAWDLAPRNKDSPRWIRRDSPRFAAAQQGENPLVSTATTKRKALVSPLFDPWG
jgi:hypothetical protein